VPDAIEPRSALADLHAHGGTASSQASEAGVTVREVRGGAILQLGRPGPEQAVTAALAALGLTALPEMGRLSQGSSIQLLPVGPRQWLLVADDPNERGPTLRDLLAPAFEPVLIMSDAWTRIRIEGSHSGDLLAKGAIIDLHPKQFAVGACAVTAFAGMRIVLWRGVGDDRFDLLVGRSLSVALWHWLVESAEEFAGTCLLAGPTAHIA
jgi:heterotetrameric sarcosine oxidase gamma subunit